MKTLRFTSPQGDGVASKTDEPGALWAVTLPVGGFFFDGTATELKKEIRFHVLEVEFETVENS